MKLISKWIQAPINEGQWPLRTARSMVLIIEFFLPTESSQPEKEPGVTLFYAGAMRKAPSRRATAGSICSRLCSRRGYVYNERIRIDHALL
jgi:hypothetical protein